MSEEENEFEMLLNEISRINEKYEEIYRKNGENFNIFDILDANDEMSYSRILAALLDPNGTHGKGDKFLELFLGIIAEKYNNIDIDKFCKENLVVKLEESIGHKDLEKETGGRLDITIKNTTINEMIYIENKPFAPDQNKQLLRYSKENPTYLIYLTKDGRPASKESTCGVSGDLTPYDVKDTYQNNKYITLSYRNDIIKWLEKCITYSEDNAILKAILAQYISLIKPRSKEMEEIVKVISENDKYVLAAFDIKSKLDEIKKCFLKKTFRPPIEELKKELGLPLDIEFTDWNGRYWGFNLIKENDLKWNNYLKIRFEFGERLNTLYYGFHGEKIPDILLKELQEKNIINNTYSMWYQFKIQLPEYCNTRKFFQKLVEEKDKIIEEFKKNIKELIDIAKKLKNN